MNDKKRKNDIIKFPVIDNQHNKAAEALKSYKDCIDQDFEEKIKKLGGKIEYPGLEVSFPKRFRLKCKEEALTLIDILIDSGSLYYAIEVETPYKALKRALKEGCI